MALYDNKYWLLSHIRNSFISTDGTGMCELVMAGESKEIKKYIAHLESYRDPEESDDDDDDFGSCEYHSDAEFGVRDLSNAAVHHERLDQAKKKSARTTNIKWESGCGDEIDVDELFVRKDVTKSQGSKGIVVSRLTELMRSTSHIPKNPFIEYARFDGSGQVNVPTKTYKIYLTMLPAEQRCYPLNVCCIASARVQDCIGLILLKYSSIHGTDNLLPVTQYGLYITEDDGEVDRDLPCLDQREPISKFGFTFLGLVEQKDFKSVSFPEETYTIFAPRDESSRTRTLSDKAKAEETRQMESDIQAIERHNKLMEAPLYRSYRVFMVTKVKRKIEVNMGISGDRIEIDPVQQKTSKLIPFKQKAVSFPIESIVRCNVTDTKYNKTSFRLEYHSSDAPTLAGNLTGASLISSSSKHYDFECEDVTAQDIVNKVKLLIEMKSNTSGIEQKGNKEKKLVKKKSLNAIK